MTASGLTSAQYYGYRLHQLAVACRADPVIGPVFGTQVKLIIAWQASNMMSFVNQALGYISTTYYSGGLQQDVQWVAESIYVHEVPPGTAGDLIRSLLEPRTISLAG